MSLYDWISNTTTRVRTDGTTGVFDSVYNIYSGGWRIACARLPFGLNIFEREWDMLIILDGCRTDLFEDVVGEYDTLGPVEEVLSVGSSSREWLAKTFVPEHRDEIERTAYVSANPFVNGIGVALEDGGNRLMMTAAEAEPAEEPLRIVTLLAQLVVGYQEASCRQAFGEHQRPAAQIVDCLVRAVGAHQQHGAVAERDVVPRERDDRLDCIRILQEDAGIAGRAEPGGIEATGDQSLRHATVVA
jgi:hypothetical protein